MLIAFLAAAALIQQTAVRADTTKRVPPTAEVIASAFVDADARDLYNRARQTHLAQDSALGSYDAKVRQRMSVLASIGRIGPEKLVYRQESAARVQWDRSSGAHVEITGMRVAIPVAGVPKAELDEARDNATNRDVSPIPFFPGSETIWIGGGTATAEIDERRFIHPLANGAEAWYTFATGDSATFRLPDGKMVRIREIKVRPRIARVNLVVGSLWFERESGHLVRATYRLAASARAGVSVSNSDTTKGLRLAQIMAKAIMGSGTAEISAINVEYGLYQGRFWLPRSQSLQGHVEFMFARVPLTYENSFEYASVNTNLGLAAFKVDTSNNVWYPTLRRAPASLDAEGKRKWRDSAMVVWNAFQKARQDSVSKGMTVGSLRQCDSASTRVITSYRFDAKVPVQTRVPCDIVALTKSPDFTGSIYDANDDVFGSAERDRAIADALSMSTQAPFSLFALSLPRSNYGLTMTRFNRVEGLSTGFQLDQELGGGFSLGLLGRYGFSDGIPNGEVSIARTNGSQTLRVRGYSRLVSANDWGTPLSLGASVSALLFGRDEGFYYRAAGAELLWRTERGARLDWRAFAEHDRSAIQTRNGYIPNIAAREGNYQGVATRYAQSFGVDPHGLRVFTDLRLEAAQGDSSYGRAALDVTLSRELTERYGAALTVGGGSSVGSVPTQRRWFLGGLYTVRGQSPDTAQSGSAYWFGRTEFARINEGYKLIAFGDLGWTGDRSAWQKVGRPLSGAGVGVSAFDGFLRLDVARGIYPLQQTRVNFYLDGRF